MKKRVIFTIFVVIVISIFLSILFHISKIKNNGMSDDINADVNISSSEESLINIVPTVLDEATDNSAWCATFQLVWNDMKNELVKQDVVFNPQLEMVENLNKETFTENMISDEYYYKKWGYKNLEIKEEIEKGIDEKFSQKSDILDKINWEGGKGEEYIFYSMLYRKFEYLKEFDYIENGTFKDRNDIESFGLVDSTDNSVGNQIDVLYYKSNDDFAILINTKDGDEVIFNKNPKGNNFKEIYDNMMKQSEKFDGKVSFSDMDRFMAPKINFNELRKYNELINKPFMTANGEIIEISEAMQTIKFTLDEKGGEIKSEAALTTLKSAMLTEEPRDFYLDDTFAIFLKEEDKDFPYFAAKIDDISLFQ